MGKVQYRHSPKKPLLYSDSTTVLTRTRARRTFLNSTRQLEDGDRPCGILVSPCPHACVSGQVTVRWIHQFTANLRYSTEEAVGRYIEQMSTVRNIRKASHGSLFLRCGLFSRAYGVGVPYHAWQLTQRSSPRGENTKLSPDCRSNLTNSLVPRCRATFHLGCTAQGSMMGTIGTSSTGMLGMLHARTYALYCTALRCTHCMKERKSIRGCIYLPAVSAIYLRPLHPIWSVPRATYLVG